MQAVTRVNAGRASKSIDVEADPAELRGRLTVRMK